MESWNTPIELRQTRRQRAADLAFFVLAHLLNAFLWGVPWYVGYVIAAFRWSGAPLTLSLSISTVAAFYGWRLMWRIAAKLDYLEIARLLGQLRIEDAPEWALFPQQEQELLAMYHARCLSRWGVNMRSSGWECFCRSWRWDAAFVPVCMALAVHPWWLGL